MLIKCLAVSSNNSFGLHEHIFLTISGKFYKALKTGQFKLQGEEKLTLPNNDILSWFCHNSYECGEEVPAAKDTTPLVKKHFTAKEIQKYNKTKDKNP